MKILTPILVIAAVVLGLASFVRAASPAVGSVSALSVTQGESTVLHAELSDADADLYTVKYEVFVPGAADWLDVGTLRVSGSSSKADLVWTPSQTGIYQVRVKVTDSTTGDGTTDTASAQSTFEIFTGKLIIAPVTIANGVARLHEFDGQILTTENTSTAKVVVQNGGNFILWSGGQVILKPGFHAQEGSFFWAAVDHDMNGYSDLEEATDSDGDGIPDAWEVDRGLNPIFNDANLDPDGDGLTNLQEYQQGRDPKKADNPNVAFAVFTPAN